MINKKEIESIVKILVYAIAIILLLGTVMYFMSLGGLAEPTEDSMVETVEEDLDNETVDLILEFQDLNNDTEYNIGIVINETEYQTGLSNSTTFDYDGSFTTDGNGTGEITVTITDMENDTEYFVTTYLHEEDLEFTFSFIYNEVEEPFYIEHVYGITAFLLVNWPVLVILSAAIIVLVTTAKEMAN